MLVLTRRTQESVEIYCRQTGRHLLTVSAVELRGDKIRLGFEAEYDDIEIIRSELPQPVPST